MTNSFSSTLSESLEEKRAAKNVQEFIDWAVSSESGIECSGVELRYCGPQVGLGVFACRNIRWNEHVLKIPKRLIITADVVRRIPEYAAILENSAITLNSFEVLVLFFGLERFYLDVAMNLNSKEVTDLTSVLQRFLRQRTAYGSDEGIGIDSLSISNCSTNSNDSLPSSSRSSPSSPTFSSPWLATNRLQWWSNYFYVLPREFTTALASCGAEKFDTKIAEQISTSLPAASREIFLKQIGEFERVSQKLKIVLAGFWDRALFLWAWHVVNTRCIWIDPAELAESLPPTTRYHKKLNPSTSAASDNEEDDAGDDGGENDDGATSGDCIAVVPMLDMLNHSPNAQCVATYDRRATAYAVSAQNRAIVEGAQIFVCYGPHDNARLWLEYGFRLSDENIFNRVNIPIDLFVALARRSGLAVGELSAHHEQVLREAELSCTLYGSDDEPSYGLRKNCRIALLRRSQLTDWRRVIFRESTESPPPIEDVSINNDANLKRYSKPTTVDNENVEKVARQMLYRILSDLRAQLTAKAEKVVVTSSSAELLRSFWIDQTRILDHMLRAAGTK